MSGNTISPIKLGIAIVIQLVILIIQIFYFPVDKYDILTTAFCISSFFFQDKENYHFEKPPAPRGHQSQGSSSNNGAPATPLASKGTSALAKTPSLSLMSGASGPAAIADCTPRQVCILCCRIRKTEIR